MHPDLELAELRNALTMLTVWAQDALIADRDPRQVAEHLAETLDALVSGEPVPDAPF